MTSITIFAAILLLLVGILLIGGSAIKRPGQKLQPSLHPVIE